MVYSIRLWLETQIGSGRSGRIFVSEVVHIQCSKLFKGLKCTVLSMILCAIKNPWHQSIRVGHIPGCGLPSVAILTWLCKKRREAKFTNFQGQLQRHLNKHYQWFVHCTVHCEIMFRVKVAILLFLILYLIHIASIITMIVHGVCTTFKQH